jgi:hypothetical protein
MSIRLQGLQHRILGKLLKQEARLVVAKERGQRRILFCRKPIVSDIRPPIVCRLDGFFQLSFVGPRSGQQDTRQVRVPVEFRKEKGLKSSGNYSEGQRKGKDISGEGPRIYAYNMLGMLGSCISGR